MQEDSLLDDDDEEQNTLASALLSVTLSSAKGLLINATTVQVVRENLVKVATKLEMEHFCTKNVHSKVPRAEVFQRAGKAAISVKWVDVNKGDDECPNCRIPLVATEIRKNCEDSILRQRHYWRHSRRF